jgi:ABC-type nitrate/sulfonate/bicarbonate transport system ATPase subunit
MSYDYTRTSEVLLDLKDVSLSFGDKLILRDINVQVRDIERQGVAQGQVICFLGPSGIGKTQLSRVIAGLQVPSDGTVLLKDGVHTGPGKVCMVPQHYPMFDYMTVAQNLQVAGKMGGLTRTQINEKASGYIELFSLKDHLAKYPKELSGGTKQRVAIVRQLMCATNYMVMDEPFSGLDPIMKKAAQEAIVKLSQLDTYNTVILVTHDVTEGLTVADTCWMMGYELDDSDKRIGGARILHHFDLAELGFAWREDLDHDPKFLEFVREVKDKFRTLK